MIVERFELTSPDELVCRYTVTESAHDSTSSTAQYLSVRSSDPLFEFARHEGGHATRGMLAGARQELLLAVKQGQTAGQVTPPPNPARTPAPPPPRMPWQTASPI